MLMTKGQRVLERAGLGGARCPCVNPPRGLVGWEVDSAPGGPHNRSGCQLSASVASAGGGLHVCLIGDMITHMPGTEAWGLSERGGTTSTGRPSTPQPLAFSQKPTNHGQWNLRSHPGTPRCSSFRVFTCSLLWSSQWQGPPSGVHRGAGFILLCPPLRSSRLRRKKEKGKQRRVGAGAVEGRAGLRLPPWQSPEPLLPAPAGLREEGGGARERSPGSMGLLGPGLLSGPARVIGARGG